MVDPLASIFGTPEESDDIQNRISNYIRIEEAIDCRDANSRFFSLLNRESGLNIIISAHSVFTSCKLDDREIIINKNLYRETHETWAVGDRPYQRLSSLTWSSHVRGSELVLSSTNANSSNNSNNINSNSNSQQPHTSLYFELTRSNELNCIGKLKTIHLQHQLFYFNLNQTNTRGRSTINGHSLAVKCNGNMDRIHVQQTRLLCPCNKLQAATISLAQAFVSDIPRDLLQSPVTRSADGHPAEGNPDDVIICDSIYSLESNCALDYLQAHLLFLNRSVIFEVKSAKPSSGSNGNNNVSSSTTSSTHQRVMNASWQCSQSGSSSNTDLSSNLNLAAMLQTDDVATSRPSSALNLFGQQQHSTDDSVASSSCNSRVKLEPVELSTLSSSIAAAATPSSSSYTNNLPSSNEAKHQVSTDSSKFCQSNYSSQHPVTMLRIRVRVTNFGVSILPHMMTNYTSTYKFIW